MSQANSFPVREGQNVPRGQLPHPPQRRVGDRHHRRDLRQPERRRVLAARRLHADLLVDAPAALQRALAGVQGAGHRRDRLPLGQRPVRDGGLGPATRKRTTSSCCADGNGEFTEKMGLLVDKSDLNFGKRSWRYSMLVRNGRIEKQFIEPQEPGDPFKVSDADTMLAYINPSGEEARSGRDPDARGLFVLRQGQARAERGGVRLRRTAAAAHDPLTRHRCHRRGGHRPAGLHQRPPDRRRRGPRRLPAARRVSQPRRRTGGCRRAIGTRLPCRRNHDEKPADSLRPCAKSRPTSPSSAPAPPDSPPTAPPRPPASAR